ncbi:glycosyltransferase [Scytonema sp. NUACC26]|uniref:glycosyltransferase n=1 Tax=Scytonema sp. NUACC26 TaxID=3140176 RepID=UPI0034DBF9B7
MTHFGLICPASTGHLNTMLPLGKELQNRGHRVTLIGVLDGQSRTIAAGLEFQAIGESEFPIGAMAQSLTELGKLNGLAATKHTINLLKQSAIVILRDLPKVIKEIGVEALLVDQISSGGASVAESLGIPYITVCSAVVLNREPSIPPHFKNWSYNPAWWAYLRNQMGYKLLTSVSKPIRKTVAEYRKQHNLPLPSRSNDAFSPLAQISQQPAEFEYPRQNLPKWFHFTGPYHNSTGRESIAFPYDKLTGQPLIYASLGTVQNRLQYVFQDIARACEGLNVQLVMSLGGALAPEALPNLPGNPLVVKYAPQLELLQKASLTITHAGLNTTLECLTHGVPMVAIPIANDQPGIAARIAWTGTGEVVPLQKLNVSRLRNAIERVLTQESYKQNALRLQEAIRKAGGVTRAADIVEKAVATGQPVLA